MAGPATTSAAWSGCAPSWRLTATPGKSVWFTELGWSTHSNNAGGAAYDKGVTEAQQAAYSVSAVRFVSQTYPYVTNMFFYTDVDRTDSSVQTNNLGLMRSDLTPKPARFGTRFTAPAHLGLETTGSGPAFRVAHSSRSHRPWL